MSICLSHLRQASRGGQASGRSSDYHAPYERSHYGNHRQPLQAAGDRLPLQRDLRRASVRLGLGPAGGRAEAERQERVVALDGPRPGRRRRARELDPDVAQGVGGLRARRDVHRPARRVHELPPSVPRRPHRPREVVPGLRARPAGPSRASFHLMFKTHMGPVEDSAHVVYLRPETAQGMFVDFLTVQTTSRKRIPFGIAQQGKSFRNEITPGNFVFRTREFEQMEMEFFVKPGTDDEWQDYWLEERMNWYHGPRYPARGEPPSPRARGGRAVALREAHLRHRVRLPRHGLVRARGDRQPHRLRPEGPLGAFRPGPLLLRCRNRGALRPVRDRAGGRSRARHAGVPDRRVPEDEAPTASGQGRRSGRC